ncbi:hypothetical protein PL9214500559 [Planktothrix tepida PCC 9214]|uniref:Uncharacterized protein n=1 Tax=Planktothrix tepida PCC 9214 TaxID=671072 RepID=A0A1J1LLC0_9CYAN|nr:hypothetical protein PL9214500559 [Planktothrix tepida PCC 9214]
MIKNAGEKQLIRIDGDGHGVCLTSLGQSSITTNLFQGFKLVWGIFFGRIKKIK